MNNSSDHIGPLVVDVQGLFSSELHDVKPAKEICDQIISACKEWGFFQLINHQFDPQLSDAMTEQMHKFFDLSLEEKLQVGW